MRLTCRCEKFQLELTAFPARTPGRLVCYCDDCQLFLWQIGRVDLLDAAGGSEIIPVYPSDAQIVAGAEQLRCTRLSDKGMYRFSTKCCDTPVGNTDPVRPWLGLHRALFNGNDAPKAEQMLGPVKARIMGKFARGPVPAGTPAKMSLKAAIPIAPFIIKGIFGKRARPSPFFAGEQRTPVVPPKVLASAELEALRQRWAAGGGGGGR